MESWHCRESCCRRKDATTSFFIYESSTKIKTNLKKTFPEVFRVSGQPLDSFDAVAAHDQVHGRDDLLGHRGRDGRGVAGGLRVDPQVVDQLEENVEGQTFSSRRLHWQLMRVLRQLGKSQKSNESNLPNSNTRQMRK